MLREAAAPLRAGAFSFYEPPWTTGPLQATYAADAHSRFHPATQLIPSRVTRAHNGLGTAADLSSSLRPLGTLQRTRC